CQSLGRSPPGGHWAIHGAAGLGPGGPWAHPFLLASAADPRPRQPELVTGPGPRRLGPSRLAGLAGTLGNAAPREHRGLWLPPPEGADLLARDQHSPRFHPPDRLAHTRREDRGPVPGVLRRDLVVVGPGAGGLALDQGRRRVADRDGPRLHRGRPLGPEPLRGPARARRAGPPGAPRGPG